MKVLLDETETHRHDCDTDAEIEIGSDRLNKRARSQSVAIMLERRYWHRVAPHGDMTWWLAADESASVNIATPAAAAAAAATAALTTAARTPRNDTVICSYRQQLEQLGTRWGKTAVARLGSKENAQLLFFPVA